MDVTPLNSTVGLTQLQFSPVSYFSRAQQNKACRRVLPAVLCPWWGVTPASCFTCVRYPIIEPLMSSLLKSKQTKTKQITKSTAYINSNPNLYCNCQPTYLRLSAGWRKEKSFLLELVRLPVILSWLARDWRDSWDAILSPVQFPVTITTSKYLTGPSQHSLTHAVL